MRLTLRTLLAYLDDALPPDKAQEIGQKVAESTVAQELIERIKKVTRRRSLPNPPIHGDASTLDPNTVTDYIDGQLPADEVEHVDEICLEDDVYLAEVAACHQILTLMLSEPAQVPPSARQRMYGLVKGPEAIPFRKPPSFRSDDGNLAAPKPERKAAHWLWYVGGVLIATAGLALTIWLAWPHDPAAPRQAATNPELTLASGTARPTTPATAPTTKPDANKTNSAKSAPSDSGSTKIEAPKNGAPLPAPAPKKPIDQPPVSTPNNARRELGKVISANSVLLQQTGEPQTGWLHLLHGQRVSSQAPLLSLPAFRNEIQLDCGVHLLLWGSVPEFQGPPTFESCATLHVPADGVDVDVTVLRGRLVLQNKRPQQTARVRLRFRKEIWDLTLQAHSDVIVDIEIAYAPGVRFSKDPGGEEPTMRVFLGVPKGKTTLKVDFQKPLELQAPPGPALVGWDSKGGAVRETVRLKELLPVWSATLPEHAAARDMAKARDELAQNIAKRAASVRIILSELGQESLPTAQVLAIFCLGAIESLPDLLDALDDADKPIVRGAAIFAIRHWCARAGGNDLQLHRLLVEKKNYTEAQADLVLYLLHYFSEADLQQPQTFTALFSYLGHERLAIRELAFSHLAQVDPDGARQTQYNPAGSDDERTAAVARWRKRIPEGKLPPKLPNPPRP